MAEAFTVIVKDWCLCCRLPVCSHQPLSPHFQIGLGLFNTHTHTHIDYRNGHSDSVGVSDLMCWHLKVVSALFWLDCGRNETKVNLCSPAKNGFCPFSVYCSCAVWTVRRSLTTCIFSICTKLLSHQSHQQFIQGIAVLHVLPMCQTSHTHTPLSNEK